MLAKVVCCKVIFRAVLSYSACAMSTDIFDILDLANKPPWLEKTLASFVKLIPAYISLFSCIFIANSHFFPMGTLIHSHVLYQTGTALSGSPFNLLPNVNCKSSSVSLKFNFTIELKNIMMASSS